MQCVHAWLVVTDLWFVKSPRIVSKRVPTRAGSGRQERATADSRSDDSDSGCDEDSTTDADANDAAAAAGNGDDESLLCMESAGGTSAPSERPVGKRRRTACVI